MSNPPPQFQPDPALSRERAAPLTPAPAGPPPASAARVGRDAWPPWLSITAFAAGFGATIVLGLVVITIGSAFGASTTHPPPGMTIGLTVVQNAALLCAAYFFAALSGRPAGGDFGLRRVERPWRAVRLLFAVWIGFFFVAWLWSLVLQLDEKTTVPDDLGVNGSLVNAIAAVVIVTVVAPIGEEVFFRGFYFGALRNWRGPGLAAVLTGLTFGLIHAGSAPVGQLVPLAVLGFGLCLLYEWTGSLYPPIALHALNNSIALGSLQHWSWQIPAMMVGSTLTALLCARLLGRLVGTRATVAPPGAAAPERV